MVTPSFQTSFFCSYFNPLRIIARTSVCENASFLRKCLELKQGVKTVYHTPHPNLAWKGVFGILVESPKLSKAAESRVSGVITITSGQPVSGRKNCRKRITELTEQRHGKHVGVGVRGSLYRSHPRRRSVIRVLPDFLVRVPEPLFRRNGSML
jgi:hypothetical protein